MTLSASTYRAEIYEDQPDEKHTELRRIAAENLQPFRCHIAGGGSEYVYIGSDTHGDGIKVRFADHENTSSKHDEPDYNVVDRDLTHEELEEIRGRVSPPFLCKKTAFAKYVGLTIPKLKKLLTPECYERVAMDPLYPNTMTEFVIVRKSIARVRAAGITTVVPVAQEMWSEEDYGGDRYW